MPVFWASVVPSCRGFIDTQCGAFQRARHARFVEFGELEMRDPRAGVRRQFGGLAAMLRTVPIVMKIIQRTRSNHHRGETD